MSDSRFALQCKQEKALLTACINRLLLQRAMDARHVRHPAGFNYERWKEANLPLPPTAVVEDWVSEGSMRFGGAILISGFESGLIWDIMTKPPTAAMLLQLLRIDALPSLDSDSTFFIYIYHFSILDGPLGDMQKVINWVEEELGTVLLDFYAEVVKISDIRFRIRPCIAYLFTVVCVLGSFRAVSVAAQPVVHTKRNELTYTESV
ncbi:hypothetical protein DFH06DRAFT_1177415 [Mycena polygramma]|nr:hypothetical protein DFH06DRAFT_1177415 [Mycena polygramma]